MTTNVEAAITSIDNCMREATHAFLNSHYNHKIDKVLDHDEDNDLAEYYIERAYEELLVLLDHLNLATTYKKVETQYQNSKTIGYTQSKMGPDEPYLTCIEKMRMIVDGISNLFGLGDLTTSGLRDLKSIIDRSLYAICNIKLFPTLPEKEADVHDRIEEILRCYYSDLQRKPPISKPIKHFEPDTGIPSTKTLIEYKFIKTTADARRVADEILADTRGYQSSDWKNVLFVIYETHRIMQVAYWKELLCKCGLGGNYDVVVLCGDSNQGQSITPIPPVN